MEKQDIIFVPSPGAGHLVVSIEFAKSLIKRDNRIHTITILHWTLPFVPQSKNSAKSLLASEPRIRLLSLPEIQNPPPLELFFKASEAYLLDFTKKTVPLVREALSALVSPPDGTKPVRIAGLVIDFFCVPLIDVGNEFNLPSYILLTCNAGFLGMMKYLPERHSRTPSQLDLSSGEEEHSIPGYVCPVPTKVMPPGQFVRESYEAWVEIAAKLPEAKGILVNSFTSLEKNAFDYFARLHENYPPVYPVGGDGGLEKTMLRQFKPRETKTSEEQVMSKADASLEPLDQTTAEEVDLLTTCFTETDDDIIVKDDKLTKKRKDPFEGMESMDRTRKPVLVFGGNSKSTQEEGERGRNSTSCKKQKPAYNHYANGSGFWDCDMEGVDSEEVGHSEVWEGVGSTTFGDIVDWH